MSFTSSTTLLMIVNGIGVPARLLPGYIADKCGQLNIQVPVAYCFALVAWCCNPWQIHPYNCIRRFNFLRYVDSLVDRTPLWLTKDFFELQNVDRKATRVPTPTRAGLGAPGCHLS